ncbi:MAG: hypothetical protein AB8B55_01180 [Mariniblastus sp.]
MKSRSGLEEYRKEPRAARPTMPVAEKVQTRMVVAIFERPELTWFFKVSGPVDQVKSAEQSFREFVTNVEFKEGQPKWELPDAWSTGGQKPMRFATLLMNNENPPLELSISQLSSGQDLLLNVNRWRGQIGLPPATKDDLDGQLSKESSAAGEYLVFDQTGLGSGTMRPPFAGGGPFSGGSGAAPFAGNAPLAGMGSAAGANSGPKFAVPKGWTKLASSSIVRARLEKKLDGKSAQITIVEMPADANEWDPNVKRWGGQVGLGELSKEEFEKRTTEINVDGTAGKMVELIDLESESELATVAGMIKRDGSAWFLKLSGDKNVVAENQGDFKEFVQSIRFSK